MQVEGDEDTAFFCSVLLWGVLSTRIGDIDGVMMMMIMLMMMLMMMLVCWGEREQTLGPVVDGWMPR